MSFVEFKNIQKSFGDQKILQKIDLEISKGEFLVLVGPSGCGKSTLLRILAGLETPTEGDILVNGKSVLSKEPKDRDLAMVFQNYALYPHLNVFENLAFGLRLRQVSESEIQARVKETAEILQIQNLLERKPKALSGGQRQRVALGRALVRKTSILLFDEPLSNLDANLRNQMRYEIKRLHQLTKSTIIYVTHDQVEATTLGDRIAVLNKGHIEQVDSAHNIYEKPANTFVASFIGLPEMNFLPGDLVGRPGASVGIRPENISISAEPRSGALEAQFDVCEYLGANYLIYAQLQGQAIRLLSPHPPKTATGGKFFVSIPLEKSIFFDKVSGHLL
ncbi:MAG: sn-glycerol-3-phosphate import ATP-binding protein UgpC [Oligoflexia bacterium]|nr:MAG: sn-glycerol-3-phosphate import ATP-binding protein UgpC [Oligoflexia bacterium]